MMAQDRKLPEGTDKIIPGAAETVEEVVVVEAVIATPASSGSGGTGTTGGTGGTGGSGTTGAGAIGGTGTSGQTGGAGGSQGGGNQPSSGGGQSGSGGGRSGGQGDSGKAMDKVRSGGEKLSDQAADKARGFVGQGLERSGDALSNVSRLVSDTASGLDERLGSEYGDYARRAADAIDSTAQKLRSKSPDELIDDTRSFVRKSPGVALAGAAIIGFALARLVKSGLDAGRSDSEGETGGQTRFGDTGGQSGQARGTGTAGTGPGFSEGRRDGGAA